MGEVRTVRLTSRGRLSTGPAALSVGPRYTTWHGARLDAIEAMIRLATPRTWQGKCPVVERVTTPPQTGVTLTKDAMKMVETPLQRLPGVAKWFVDIVPTSSTIPAT